MDIESLQIIQQVFHLEKNSKNKDKDKAIDFVFDAIDELLRKGKFTKVNSVIAGIEVEDMSTTLLLTFLTTTAPARSKLPFRPEFYNKVEKTILNRGKLKDNILYGLK